MARYRVQGPDGQIHVFEGPDDATPAQVEEFAAKTFASQAKSAAPAAPQLAPRPQQPADEPGMLASIGAGIGKGVGSTALGLQHYLGKGVEALGGVAAPAPNVSSLITGQQPQNIVQRAGSWLVNDAALGRKKLEGELAPYKAANPISAGGGEIAGEIAATLPVGGLIAKPLFAASKAAPALAPLAPLADAVATGGMRAGQAAGVPGFLTRMAGGAVTGGVSSELVNPGDASGVIAGGAMPIVGKVAGYAGNAIGAAARPFFKAGQERIAGTALRDMATNPAEALRGLQQAQQVVPGSAPIAAAAAGDEGLSGLHRTLQSVSPDYAAELAARQSAQNAARTRALDAVAGTPGRIEAAQAARDAATGPIREAALAAAGQLDAQPIANAIQRMMADPNNAGATTRAALNRVLQQLSDVAGQTGKIDARALYEIRKDVGLAMNGKLQGEAGNLRYARGALDRVQSMIDTAIENAGNRAAPTGSALAMPGANVATAGAAGAAAGPRASWRDYLSQYAQQSVPINQMETLANVLRRVQTGTVDREGNAILSAANLNNILKNEGADLQKRLAPDQLDLLRRLRADLNAQQLANNSGKAIGSNTVQNLASAGSLSGLIGGRAAGSQPVQATVGRALDWAYQRGNRGVIDQLSEAMLDPARAAQLMQQASQPGAIEALFSRPGLRQIPYRAAPVLTAQ